MTEPKKPQDRKPKASPVDDGPLKVTVEDHEWSIERAALDDFELLDDLARLESSEDASRVPSVLRRLFGGEQFREAMNVLRDPDTGRVGTERASRFVMDVINALNPNSEGSRDS